MNNIISHLTLLLQIPAKHARSACLRAARRWATLLPVAACLWLGQGLPATAAAFVEIEGARSVATAQSAQLAATELDFGGAYGYVNGGSSGATQVNNPATNAPTCPSGYTVQQIYGTSGNDWPVFICFRPHSAGIPPLYDFGGMWGFVNGTATSNPLTGSPSCSPGFGDLLVLSTSGADWPLHVCYRSHIDNAPMQFGGVLGTVGAQPVPNQITHANTCAAGYQEQAVLGTSGTDWPLSFCYASVPSQSAGLDFGGVYGYINGSSQGATAVPNPATGLQSCPSGYTGQQVFGTSGADWPVFFCFRAHSDSNPPVYDFGGMWGYVNGTATANPLTGEASCANGFNDLAVLGTSGTDWPLHVCYRPHVSNEPLWFGGVIGTVNRDAVPIPATGAASCPPQYTRQAVLGTIGTDWPLSYCYAIPQS